MLFEIIATAGKNDAIEQIECLGLSLQILHSV